MTYYPVLAEAQSRDRKILALVKTLDGGMRLRYALVEKLNSNYAVLQLPGGIYRSVRIENILDAMVL